MSEIAPAASLPIQEQDHEAPLDIRYSSFAEARQATKKYSDEFIDNTINEQSGGLSTFSVGTESVGLKGYLDKVEATPEDEAIIDNPEAIARVYLSTTDMLSRNLKIKVASGTKQERVQVIADAKQDYISRLHDQALETADAIVAWTEVSDPRVAPRPGEGFGYYGFNVGEGDEAVDALAWGEKGAPDFHSNIKIQRQGGGNFIFAYSDSRVNQRMSGQKDTLDKRIYLNPDVMATPQVFEQILQAANQAGIPLEMKMLQRSEELGAAHIEKQRNQENGDALRGDGVVIYASGESADDVLALALAVAQDNPTAFKGRKTSRIPQPVAEGIAVGSEPEQMPGKDVESLTSHRAILFSTVARKVAASGKTGEEAREAFRRGVKYYAERERVDPNNLAFNMEAA